MEIKKEVKKKILTIDDDPEINALIKRHVTYMGYEVKTTTDPESFLKEVEEFQPDLCLIDLDIGESQSGLILVEAILMAHHGSLPIVILSRHDDTEVISNALESGAMDYMIKPPTKERLVTLLDRYAPQKHSDKSSTPLYKVPATQARAEISYPLEWNKIDEMGLWFSSKNLISRGSIFYFKDPEFEKITGRTTPALLTVSENFLKPGATQETYRIYGTFDPSDIELQNRVRNWLIKKK
ncbi:MAG: response regulator [Xanthomonadaceae bacterium]|nr:response regulator [Xanthomonadaceae bacterium]